MLIDGLTLAEGTNATNLVIANGSSFPSSPDQGELFYLNTAQEFFPEGLYFYSGTSWTEITTSVQLNEIATAATTVISGTTYPSPAVNGELFYKSTSDGSGDAGLYVYQSATSEWTTVSSGVELANHIADTSVHLTSTQNTWLDAITATSAEVNYLSGVTNPIQTQINNKQALDADLTAIAGLAGTNGFLKKTAADTWSLDTNTYLTGNQSITVSGDASGTGTTAISLTLANSGATAGTYKSVTVNAKGLVTAGTNPTTLAGYGITDAQALDADLTAIAALAGTSGFLKKTAADTWALDTSTYLTAHPTIAGATSVSNSGLTYIQSLTFDSNGHVTGEVSTTIQSASTSQQGVVQLSDSTSTTSSTVAATSTAVKTSYDLATAALPKSGGSMTGSIVIPAGSKITLTDAPVVGTDAVNKNYVDSNLAGLSWKNSVKATTTANITLSGTQTIDGISVVAGDRVLVKNQTATSENGIYIVASGSWTRATDMDSTTPINEVNSAAVFVEQGTQADTGWTQINLVSTLDTDAVAFTQFNGAAGITAGVGLVKTGNTLDIQLGAGIAQLPTDEIGVDVYTGGGLMTTVDGTTSSTVTAAQLSLTKVGTSGTYKSVTVDTYGRVTAGTNPTTLAGYGITDAQALDADLTAIAALSGTSGFLKKTATDTWALDTSTYLTGNQTITLTGAITGSGTTSINTTLANSGVSAGTYKSVTVDIKGIVTSGTNPTTLAGYGITDAQSLDADLTAIAALSGTSGYLKKTAANTWALDVQMSNWTIKTSAYTAISGDMILADSTSAAFTITLPASPVAGNQVIVADAGGTFNTTNVTIGRNGSNILGLAQDLVLNVANEKVTLVYYNATRGWILA